MKHEPFVSIITPFYNEERFLSEAVESVLKQDYQHWELLLIDDGSVDGSTVIAKSFAATYRNKIFYLEHENHINKGLCPSRNLGLSKAGGELIALLDSDDVWLPQKLSNQVNIFRKHSEIGMVCEASEFWHSWDKNAYKTDIIIPVGAGQDKIYPPQDLNTRLYPLSKGASPCPSGLLLRKDMLIQKGGFQNEFAGQYQLYEDQAFLTKIYLEENVFVSSACNNKYRQRVGSLVQSVKAAGNYDMVRKFYLQWLENYLERKKIHNKRIKVLIQRAWFPYKWPVLFFLTMEIPRKIKKVIYKIVKG